MLAGIALAMIAGPLVERLFFMGELDPADFGASDPFDLDIDGRRVPLLPIVAPLLELGLDRELPAVVSVPLPSEPS